MSDSPVLSRRPEWAALEDHRAHWRARLRELFAADPGRAERYVVRVGDLRIDYSKNLVTDETLALLGELAVATDVFGLRDAMFRGEKINLTERRAVLHTALRAPADAVIEVDGENVHAGKVGAGHFSKMVHNGIEYAMMQAYAEGWELLEKVDSVTDVREVFRSWQEGTVIRSWLLDLAVDALDEDEHLDKLRGYAQDSGEGRWTVEAAIDNAVPLPAITASLFARFASRQEDSPQMKMIAALRNQFGGHAVESAKKA
ncbi:Glucose-6-phosphate isomerase [Streptomyces aurantiogriseus]